MSKTIVPDDYPMGELSSIADRVMVPPDRAFWSTMAIRSEPEDWRPPWIGDDEDDCE